MGELIYPFLPFGSSTIPKQETILIKGATVWTNEAAGIMENTDVLIEDGKIIGMVSYNNIVVNGMALEQDM